MGEFRNGHECGVSKVSLWESVETGTAVGWSGCKSGIVRKRARLWGGVGDTHWMSVWESVEMSTAVG